MKRRSIIKRVAYVAAFVTLTGSGVALATAGGPGGPPFGPPGMGDPEAMHRHMRDRMERMLDRLEATEEQRNSIRAIMVEAKNQMDSAFPDRKAQMKRMADMLTQDALDIGALEQLHQEHVGLMAAAADMRFNTIVQIASVLTPDQRREARALMEARMGRRAFRAP